jgi:hypothetical protein
MEIQLTNLQLHYQGYLNTPLLWKNHAVLGLKQFELPAPTTIKLGETIPVNAPLGKLVERYVSAELQQYKSVKILLENVQIQNQKITIGEIDCILKWDGIPVHLEIVYKFYLYDPASGSSEIEHWIGPNRNDSLRQKLHKLKDKQLPLIYNEHARSVLNAIHVNPMDIVQRVRFKAQLFMPYQEDPASFNLLNRDCLKGFYVYYAEIGQFSHCQFYIPNKIDWLLEVQADVEWIASLEFNKRISQLMSEKIAPLCWIKHPDGLTEKFFVVWWT